MVRAQFGRLEKKPSSVYSVHKIIPRGSSQEERDAAGFGVVVVRAGSSGGATIIYKSKRRISVATKSNLTGNIGEPVLLQCTETQLGGYY
jgi:hypothetical protein